MSGGSSKAGSDTGPQVIAFDAGAAVAHAAGIRTSVLGIQHAEGPFGVSIYPAGGSAPMHRHNCGETVVVLQGAAELCAGTQTQRLVRYDSAWIPADLNHSYSNIGDGELHLLWLYDAAEVNRTLAGDGVTTPLLAPAGLGPSA